MEFKLSNSIYIFRNVCVKAKLYKSTLSQRLYLSLSVSGSGLIPLFCRAYQDSVMIVASYTMFGFSLLFLLLTWERAAVAAPLPIIETLVEFSPAVDSPQCRGVQISKDLIATSHECAQKARESSSSGLIEILSLSGEPLGFIAEQPSGLPENSMLLSIHLDSEAYRPNSYPALYDDFSVPEPVFTYGVDEKYQLVQQPVILADGEPKSRAEFIISSESSIPSGSAVFDLHSKLVCLSGSNDRCFIVNEIPLATVKRGIEDDDPDDEEDDRTEVQALKIVAVTVAALAGTATAIFYLATFLKACSKGMPASVFWAGILSLQYCNHCDSDSVMYAIIGLFCCPVCFCTFSAYHAASNWIEDYAASNPESAPIIQQPQSSAPPPY